MTEEPDTEGTVTVGVEVAGEQPVAAAGIGASGPVTAAGIIDNPATLPGYTGLDLCADIEKGTGWPCVIDNDAAAAAIGEYRYGAGRGSRTGLVVTLGTGIGVGVVTGGQLVRAGDGTHPEAGHIAVPDAPVPCYCGLARCWEQAASRTALEALTGADPAAVAAAARGGDVRAAQYLDLFAGALTAGLDRHAPYQWTPPIVPAALAGLSGAIGAATQARGSIPS
jgi:glucokinase